MICPDVHHTEGGAAVGSGRLDLYRSAVGGMPIDTCPVTREELETEPLGRHGVADIADQVTVMREF